MIAIIDYGLGNIGAFANVYKKLNIPFTIASTVGDLKKATRLILPGVGTFDQAMQRLNQSGMRQFLDEIVLHRHVPVLGICVGMQMLASSSEEGSLPGLGWIDGKVKKAETSKNYEKLRTTSYGVERHQTRSPKKSLFQGLDHGSRFYFLHSYYFHCPKKEDVLAVTDYGGEFVCAVNSGNVFGVQFHPEKSHQSGIQLLENFVKV